MSSHRLRLVLALTAAVALALSAPASARSRPAARRPGAFAAHALAISHRGAPACAGAGHRARGTRASATWPRRQTSSAAPRQAPGPADARRHPVYRVARATLQAIAGAADFLAYRMLRQARAWRGRGRVGRVIGRGLAAAGRALHHWLGWKALRRTSLNLSLSVGLSSPTWRHVAGVGAGVSLYTNSIESLEYSRGRLDPDTVMLGVGGSFLGALGAGWDSLSGPSLSVSTPLFAPWVAGNGSYGAGAFILNFFSVGLGVLRSSLSGGPARGAFFSLSVTPFSLRLGPLFVGFGGGFTLHHPALQRLYRRMDLERRVVAARSAIDRRTASVRTAGRDALRRLRAAFAGARAAPAPAY